MNPPRINQYQRGYIDAAYRRGCRPPAADQHADRADYLDGYSAASLDDLEVMGAVCGGLRADLDRAEGMPV